jgi:hypothetical protein
MPTPFGTQERMKAPWKLDVFRLTFMAMHPDGSRAHLEKRLALDSDNDVIREV